MNKITPSIHKASLVRVFLFVILATTYSLVCETTLAASTFTDVTAAYGVSDGVTKHYSSAWVDIDNDGDLDLYSSNFQTNNKLYLNNGLDNAFTDATGTYGIADSTTGHIISNWIDIDNDGDSDLYVTNSGANNKLYINNGDGVAFTDATATYGIADGTVFHTGATWMDIDNDGDLDLYLVNYLSNNKLYTNNGAGVAFTDSTATYGIADGVTKHYSSAWTDVDNDGDLDLYSVNYQLGNKLFINNGAGVAFTDTTATYGVADGTANHLNSAWIDIDNDGDMDLYLSILGGNNKLLINNGAGVAFTDATTTYGVADGTATHYSNAWIDIDNDGDLDLYTVDVAANKKLYRNNGVNQAFTDVTDSYGVADGIKDTNSVSWVDIDNDGDLDLYTMRWLGNNTLYENPGQGNNYLKVMVTNTSGRYQYYARVEVDIDGNNDFSTAGSVFTQFQTNSNYAGGIGYVQSQDPVGVSFGLGSDSSCKYDVRVFLPGVSPDDTPSYTFTNVCPNQTLYTPGDTLTLSSLSEYQSEDTVEITGTADHVNTAYTLTSIEYAFSSSAAATWTSCSGTTSFSCTIPTTSLADATYTIYFRTKYNSFQYSPSVSAYSRTFTLDTVDPLDFSLSSPTGYSNDELKPTLTFKKTTDAAAGLSSYSVFLDPDKQRNWSTTGIPTTGDTSTSSYVWKNNDEVKIKFQDENDTSSTNDKISVYFKDLDSSELTEGKHTWKVFAYDNAGNIKEESEAFYIDTTPPSISNLEVANVSEVIENSSYKLDTNNRVPVFIGTAIDSFHGSTKEHEGSIDKFDKVSSKPKSITLKLNKQDPDNSYTEYFVKEYELSNITNNHDSENTAKFSLTVSDPLPDGFYQVQLMLKDGADNTYTHPNFYLALNVNIPEQINYNIGGDGGDNSNTEITDIREIPALTEEEKQFVKNNGHIVKIKVLDKQKKPVRGAKVVIHSKVQEAITNDEGIAEFSNVESGDHRILVSYKDFEGVQYINLSGDVKEFDLNITIEQKSSGLSPFLYGLTVAMGIIIVFLIIKKRKK